MNFSLAKTVSHRVVPKWRCNCGPTRTPDSRLAPVSCALALRAINDAFKAVHNETDIIVSSDSPLSFHRRSKLQ